MVTPEDLGQRGHPRARGSSGTRQHGSTAARQHGSTADLRPPRSRPCCQLGQLGQLDQLGHPGPGPAWPRDRASACSATPGPGPAWPRDRLGLLGHGGTRGHPSSNPTPRNGSEPLYQPRDQARHNPPERRRTGGSGPHSGITVHTPRYPSGGVRLPGGPSRVLSGVCLGSVWGAVWGPNKRLTCTVWGVWGETAQKHPPRRLSPGVCPCPAEPRREHRPTTPETMATNNGLPNNATMALSEWSLRVEQWSGRHPLPMNGNSPLHEWRAPLHNGRRAPGQWRHMNGK